MTAALKPQQPETCPGSDVMKASVDGVFAALDCILDEGEHGGEVAAYADVHGCRKGWMCKSHLDSYRQWKSQPGADTAIVQCPDCHDHMGIGRYAAVQEF